MPSLFPVTCMPEEINKEKSIGLVKVDHAIHGKCTNKEPLKGFTECIGSCHSATTFNSSKFLIYKKKVTIHQIAFRNWRS